MSDSCDPMDCSLPGSFVHGILQARILEWVAISFSRRSSWPRNRTQVSYTAGRFFNNWAMRETPGIKYLWYIIPHRGTERALVLKCVFLGRGRCALRIGHRVRKQDSRNQQETERNLEISSCSREDKENQVGMVLWSFSHGGNMI